MPNSNLMLLAAKAAAAAEPRKIKKILKRKPIVKIIPEENPQQSIWLSMRRIKKASPPPIVWEGIEDISDDENDTPEAAHERELKIKAFGEQFRQQEYEERLEGLQAAGLFLSWSPPKLLRAHSNDSLCTGK